MYGSIQLVFSNFYLGIALGALQYASKYTVSSTRAWPFGGDVSSYMCTLEAPCLLAHFDSR